jgi:hypothetical protein
VSAATQCPDSCPAHPCRPRPRSSPGTAACRCLSSPPSVRLARCRCCYTCGRSHQSSAPTTELGKEYSHRSARLLRGPSAFAVTRTHGTHLWNTDIHRHMLVHIIRPQMISPKHDRPPQRFSELCGAGMGRGARTFQAWRAGLERARACGRGCWVPASAWAALEGTAAHGARAAQRQAGAAM